MCLYGLWKGTVVIVLATIMKRLKYVCTHPHPHTTKRILFISCSSEKKKQFSQKLRQTFNSLFALMLRVFSSFTKGLLNLINQFWVLFGMSVNFSHNERLCFFLLLMIECCVPIPQSVQMLNPKHLTAEGFGLTSSVIMTLFYSCAGTQLIVRNRQLWKQQTGWMWHHYLAIWDLLLPKTFRLNQSQHA